MKNKKTYFSITFLILYIVLISLESIPMNALGFLLLIISFILIIFLKVSILKKTGILIIYLAIGFFGLLFGFINQGHGYYDEYYFTTNREGFNRVIFSRNMGIELKEKEGKHQIKIDSIITFIHREKEEVYGRKKYYLLTEDYDTIELTEIKNMDKFNNTPSIIVKDPKFIEKYNVNIHDFIVFNNDKRTALKPESVDAKTIYMLENLRKQ